jgi:hypothetical protein
MRTIRYTDLDGNPQAVDYWFSLGKTDAIKMDFVHRDDPKAYLESIAKNQESRNVMELWEELLFKSVALRTENHLVKNQEILDRFIGSGAYEQLFNELIESEDGGAAFFLSIMPQEVQENASKEIERNTKEYTNDELLALDDETFFAVAGTKNVMDMDRRFMQIAWQRKENGRKTA